MLAIVVQGRKDTLLGEGTYHYGAAQYSVVSIGLPIHGFMVEATTDLPYLKRCRSGGLRKSIPVQPGICADVWGRADR
jgi:hypothetical protein